MSRRRHSRRRVEAANFQRQAQALTILTIGTVIFGGVLFQVGFTHNSLTPNGRIEVELHIVAVLMTGLVYVFLIAGVIGILQQTAPVKGSDIIGKVVNPLLVEVGGAIVVFAIGTMVK